MHESAHSSLPRKALVRPIVSSPKPHRATCLGMYIYAAEERTKGGTKKKNGSVCLRCVYVDSAVAPFPAGRCKYRYGVDDRYTLHEEYL